ncbi:MAG: 30S ribosomal protein S13 [Candidatus Pacearchaeota archaeon]|nr:30S ribosomal protein S13 [Candidatus Pacearchaeota archaeon]
MEIGEEKEEKQERIESSLVRIAGTDIPGKLSVYAGLTKIKGVSWSFSNAVCRSLGLDKSRKISTLTDGEIEKIVTLIKNPNFPKWLLNRRKDIETGADRHLITTDLDLAKEFDIRRMKKMKSYKGIRHALGQPVRGQRTKAHFRKGKAIGVSRAKSKPGKEAKGAK